MGWYTISRILSPFYSIKSYQLPINISSVESSDELSFRIGSFNIAHARGGEIGASNWQNRTKKDYLRHLNDIASQIKEARLDIIILNEVDFLAAWSFNINQASYIAEKAGYPNVVEQRNMDFAFPFYDFKFGNAILSRYPVIESKYIDFQPYSKLEDIFAGNHDGVLSILQTPLGKIGVIAVHLEYRNEDSRVLAVHQLKEISDNTIVPIVAAGDFNSSPVGYPGSQKTLSGKNALTYFLNKGGFQTHPGVTNDPKNFTFPSGQPKKVIDWIVEKGNLKFVDVHVVRSMLSDHSMIVSSLLVDKIEVEN